jgi:ribonucleoside-diphosphate reductase beta chain
VAFGARFLRDMAARDPRYADAIGRTLTEVLPVADGVLRPPWVDPADEDAVTFGASVRQTREFAVTALSRRMKAIGLAPG